MIPDRRRLVMCRQTIYDRKSLGYYGFVVSGTAQTAAVGVFSGSVYFNGGTLTATNVNGGINSTTAIRRNGTYTVTSNNTTSITMNLAGQTTAQTYIVAVSEAGNEAVGIETTARRSQPSTSKSASTARHTYSNAALTEFIQPPVEAVKSTSTM